MSKVTDLNSLMHYMVDTIRLETEAEWHLAHQIVDKAFPVDKVEEVTTPPLDKTPTSVEETTPPVVEDTQITD